MGMRIGRGGLVLGALLFTTSCANMNTVKTASRDPSKGTMYNYPGTCDLHWPQAEEALHHLGLAFEQVHPEKLEIYASTSAGGFTWGERVGVWLYPAANDSCNIRVYSVRVGQLNATAEDWEPQFFAVYRRPVSGRVPTTVAPASPAPPSP